MADSMRTRRVLRRLDGTARPSAPLAIGPGWSERQLRMLAHADAVAARLRHSAIKPVLVAMAADGAKVGGLPEMNGVMIGRMLAEIRQRCPVCGFGKSRHDVEAHSRDAERARDKALLKWLARINLKHTATG